MKTLSKFSRAIYCVAIISFALFGTTTNMQAQQKPDLGISAIVTPGGLCKGYDNKVRVTVTNSQQVGVSQPIKVKLIIKRGSHKQTMHAYLQNGIGPNANSGQPVWFHDIYIPSTGQVSLTAHVNPDNAVHETVYGNNTEHKQVYVNKHCGGGSPILATPKSLTVYVTKKGKHKLHPSSKIGGASVVVKRGSKTYKGKTDRSGKAIFKNVPAGKYYIYAQKGGCQKGTKTYSMPNQSSKIDLAIACR